MAAIPKLEDCHPGMRARGFCVLVAPAEQEEKTIGGIILPDQVKDKGQIVEQRGRIIDVSPAAFDFAEFGGHAPKTGDAIVFGKLAGVLVEGHDGRKYRLLNDKDVLAVLDEPEALREAA
jgi:chaperonin GroES